MLSPRVALVLAILIPLVFIVGCPPASSPQATIAAAEPDVRLELVKLADFDAAVARHKGKVVVVDFWATTCIPCRKEFHRLVELHQKHAPKGLVCMSMTVDNVEQKDAALGFLKKEKADFANFLIADKPEVWSKAWNFQNVPAVRVYGRDGKLAKQFDYEDPDNQFRHDDVEPFVLKQLEGK